MTSPETLLRRITGDEKHSESAHSTLHVLCVLYERILRIDPSQPDDPRRDRFVLSKGHGPAAFYAVLASRGFFPATWLDDVGSWTSPLGHHPDSRVPGVEIGSGSLGHGLCLGVGMALGLRSEPGPRVFVLLGDAELDEGSNHEAIAFAGAFGLGELVAIVVDNQSATHGWPGGIASRFAVNGWTTATVDGTDRDAIESALMATTPEHPHAVVVVTPAKAGA